MWGRGCPNPFLVPAMPCLLLSVAVPSCLLLNCHECLRQDLLDVWQAKVGEVDNPSTVSAGSGVHHTSQYIDDCARTGATRRRGLINRVAGAVRCVIPRAC